MSDCQNPCKKITNKLSLRAENKEVNLLAAYLSLKFKKTIRVEKKVVMHTWFHLIIDLGSSLELWLGLSALGITDLAIKAFLVV